jgi:hypothetical protein
LECAQKDIASTRVDFRTCGYALGSRAVKVRPISAGEAALLSAANAAGGTRTPDISKRNGPHRWQGFN